MADKVFEVLVKTTGDTSGADKVDQSLDRVEEHAAGVDGGAGPAAAPEAQVPVLKEILGTEKEITAEKVQQVAESTEAAAAAVQQGIDLERATRAAASLTRELATGGDISRPLGSLLAALAPALAPAAVGAAALFATMKATSVVAQELGALFGGFSLQDLASGFDAKALLEEVAAAEKLARIIRDINAETVTQQEGSVQKLGDEIQDLTQKYRAAAVAFEGLLEPITGANANLLEQTRAQIANLQAELDLRVLHLENSKLQLALETGKTEELEKQTELLRKQISAQSEVTSLQQQIRDSIASGLSDTQKVDVFHDKIGKIKSDLANLGITARSPAEALQQSIGKADELRVPILQLIKDWQGITAEENRATASIAAQTRQLEEQNAGAIAEKIRLLREAAKLNPTAGFDRQADRLAGTGPGSGKVDEDFFRRRLDQNPDDQNAKLALASLLAKQADAIQLVDTTAKAASTAIEDAGHASADGLRNIERAAAATAGQIAPLFGPTADAIQTAIPQAVAAGNQALVAAVVSAVAAIKSDFDRKITVIQSQIARLWEK